MKVWQKEIPNTGRRPNQKRIIKMQKYISIKLIALRIITENFITKAMIYGLL
jgi:hypothetical protein